MRDLKTCKPCLPFVTVIEEFDNPMGYDHNDSPTTHRIVNHHRHTMDSFVKPSDLPF